MYEDAHLWRQDDYPVSAYYSAWFYLPRAYQTTADWSINPGFCGCSNSFFTLQAAVNPSAMTDPEIAHRARNLCLIEYRPQMGSFST